MKKIIIIIIEIMLYLYFAKRIVTSHGVISYGNGIFFNPKLTKNNLIFLKSRPNIFPYFSREKFTLYEFKDTNDLFEKLVN